MIDIPVEVSDLRKPLAPYYWAMFSALLDAVMLLDPEGKAELKASIGNLPGYVKLTDLGSARNERFMDLFATHTRFIRALIDEGGIVFDSLKNPG